LKSRQVRNGDIHLSRQLSWICEEISEMADVTVSSPPFLLCAGVLFVWMAALTAWTGDSRLHAKEQVPSLPWDGAAGSGDYK
jgi:hypothetical protein